MTIADDRAQANPLYLVCDQLQRLIATAPGALSRLRVSLDGAVVEFEWQETRSGPAGPPVAGWTPAVPVVVPVAVPAGAADPAGAPVRSPMVGTFYHAPGPDADAFVEVGDVVEAGQQIGIVEAMKLMNPIETDQAGVVTAVLVPDGGRVEFDQPLITVAPVEGA
jgi:acetyl-CoA carboxylase biotin carboxyl carrier protein